MLMTMIMTMIICFISVYAKRKIAASVYIHLQLIIEINR